MRIVKVLDKKLSEKSGTTFKWTLDNVRSEETIDSCVLSSYSEIIVNPFVFFLFDVKTKSAV